MGDSWQKEEEDEDTRVAWGLPFNLPMIQEEKKNQKERKKPFWCV